MPPICSIEGCSSLLKFPEEVASGTCALCVARRQYPHRSAPSRYALVPGLLELHEIAGEILSTPGTPERSRGRAQRMQEILLQLIQHRRPGGYVRLSSNGDPEYKEFE